MAETTKLKLPLMEAAQSQKHVTHNEALIALDALVQLSVKNRALTAPPGSPSDGDRYIVASGGTGAWLGKDLNVAAYYNGVWLFFAPRIGWVAWDENTTASYTYSAGAWVAGGLPSVLTPSQVGIGGATPDATNRLSVNSPAVLFNNAGSTIAATLNKNAAGNDAAFIFQTGFSTRALFGLLADDNFTIKVSPDGSAFTTAVTINRTSGAVTLSEGHQTLATDVAFTINPFDPVETRHTGTLTAARACTLGTSGAIAGQRKRLTRSGGGAFNITFAGKSMATGTWAEAVYDGSAWYLAAYGAL